MGALTINDKEASVVNENANKDSKVLLRSAT